MLKHIRFMLNYLTYNEQVRYELNQARTDLLHAESELERTKAYATMLREKIARLEQINLATSK